MKNFLLMAGAAAVLIFSSCKKDKDNDNGGGGDKLVKKITETEVGQTIMYTVNYDGKRITSYANGIPVSGTMKVIQKTAGEPDDVQEDETCTYTVTNNQGTKILQKSNIEDYEIQADLTYQSNGNLAKAQLFGDEEYNVVFTFGTKRSAFPTISKWVLDLGASVEFSAKNELITTLMDFEGDDYDIEFTSIYTYDAAGYPLTDTMMGTTLKFEY